MRALDNCSDADALLMRNHTNAKQASYELLAAALDDDLKAVGREQRVREVLDRYVSFEDAGCSFDNNWCNAPENAYRDTACLCSTPGVASGPGSAFWLALLAGGALLRRLRRSRATAASLLATALCLLPRPAHAHDPALWKEDSHTGFAAHSTVAGAFDNGAFALTLGGRYAINNTWLVGINAEYNPWFTLNGERFARGAFNSYATAIYRYPISRHFAVRTTANLGVSVLLFDLIGAPKGSAGPYLGINLLGLSYELGDQVYLIVDPADVSVPIPKVTGAPFAYRQYRFTLGVQFGG